MTIQEVKRTRKRIFIAYHNGTEDLTIDSNENALPAFQQALDRLPELTCEIIGVDKAYALNMRALGIKMGEQGEADTVSVIAQKSLADAAKALNIVTPPRLLAHPTEPGSYTPPLTEAQADPVWALIEAAKDYVKGNRAQGILPGIGNTLGDDDESGGGEGEDPGQGKIPGTEEAEETEKPTRGKGGKRGKGKGGKKAAAGAVTPFPGSEHGPGQ